MYLTSTQVGVETGRGEFVPFHGQSDLSARSDASGIEIVLQGIRLQSQRSEGLGGPAFECYAALEIDAPRVARERAP